MYVGELCYWCWERGDHNQTNVATSSSTGTSESAPNSVEERKEDKDVPLETSAQTDRVEQKEGDVDELEVQKLKLNADSEKHSSDVGPKSIVSASAAISSTKEQGLDSDAIKRYQQSRLYSLVLNTKGVDFIKTWMFNFDPLKEGIETLAKYVEIARGPLKDHGWSYDRAVRLLVELKRTSVK